MDWFSQAPLLTLVQLLPVHCNSNKGPAGSANRIFLAAQEPVGLGRRGSGGGEGSTFSQHAMAGAASCQEETRGVPKNPHSLRVNSGHVLEELTVDPSPAPPPHSPPHTSPAGIQKFSSLGTVTKKLCMGLSLSLYLIP